MTIFDLIVFTAFSGPIFDKLIKCYIIGAGSYHRDVNKWSSSIEVYTLWYRRGAVPVHPNDEMITETFVIVNR